MAENSKIEWTTHTFNPWRGCTKVSPGCANCYAATMSKRNPATLGVWGDSGTRVVASESQWRLPLKWNREAEKSGVRARVFCASLADVFEDWQGPMVDAKDNCLHVCNQCGAWRDMESMCHGPLAHYPLTMPDVRRRLFSLIDATQNIDYLLVTKRPENVPRMWPSADIFDPKSEHKAFWNNAWLLTSVEDQAAADRRIPELLKCRDLVPVLGLSCEPLLGPVDLSRWLNPMRDHWNAASGSYQTVDILAPKIDWVIVGGESGHGARPCHPDWVRSIRDQCVAAGVPFFFKQWGEWIEEGQCGDGMLPQRAANMDSLTFGDNGSGGDAQMLRVGKHAAGRLLDGRTWDEFPKGVTT